MHPNYTPAALELTGERNPRGIPAVKFIEDVEAHLVALYCKGGTIDDLTDEKVAECVGVMQELYSKYKFMEQHLVKNKVNYRNKLPELKKQPRDPANQRWKSPAHRTNTAESKQPRSE